MRNTEIEFDEKTMIREQERLEREKKRAKSKKIVRSVLLAVIVMLVGVTAFILWQVKFKPTKQIRVEVVKQVGQEIVIAKITQMNGNEITYTVCEEVADAVSEERQRPIEDNDRVFGKGQQPEGMPERDQMPEGMEMPDMSQMPEGMPQMPDMSEMPEGMPQMPEGMEIPDRGQRGEGHGTGRGQQMTGTGEGTFVYNDKTYTLTEETVTAYIPVGTVVTTKLGTQTTFSRLAAGDYVALVVEGDEQMIMSVYIIG